MRVLFVAPWVPGPVRPRGLGLLRLVAEEHDVRVLLVARHAREAAGAEALAAQRPTVVANPRLRSLARVGLAVATGRSLQTAYADAPGLRAALAEALRAWQPDLVHLNVWRSAHLVAACEGRPTVVDLDERRSGYYAELARDGGLAWRVVAGIEAPRMAAGEEALLASAATTVVSSPADAHGGALLVRTPWAPGPGGAAAPGVAGAADLRSLLFVGRLHYGANVDALRWLVEACWPAVHAAHPALVLRVVGEAPPPALRRLLDRPGIEVHADVPDVRPFYGPGTAAVVPVRRATGVQMKLIQALAAGVPTITTGRCAALAGVTDGREALVADDPASWARAVDALVRDPGLRAGLAATGAPWASANHGVDAVRDQLRSAYRAALDGAHARA